ncbi:hypothetical protein QYE76_031606 [Lolium multiflorum]|uniref:Transposase (putative) gypsy type domain-containing protein n=1 Tax=Lolium multiflorum TaxID=4521 RepID=A0AAD8QVN2_LOLMU|nr:hypothetical protein QYE76_031606 [Lolium multiflorum]
MSSEEYLSEPSGSKTLSVSFGEQASSNRHSDGLEAELARMESSSNVPEADTGKGQEASSSGQGSGVDLCSVTRGAWKGSDVKQPEIDWLYRSRRVPAGVICRLPRGEVEPNPEPGEHVVFLAHFERGFGLPASDFFRSFLDFYELQPHHLPGNAVFYLSCYATFMEAYMGLRPTRETFARFFSLRINSVQGKEISYPKPPVQCGSCIIGSRQGSPFFKFSSLESCRAWQETFFYVKNKDVADLINLPAYQPGPPSRANWSYNPKATHIETNRIIRFMEQLMKETNICSDDIVRTFISRRVLPLQRRSHKMSEMYGPGDPTKITGLQLSKEDVVLKARLICQTDMPMNWEWGFLPLSSTNPPTQAALDRFPRIATEVRGPRRKRPVDEVDPDPYVPPKELKMGRTHTPRPASTNPQVLERVVPLQAEVGNEFLDKLTTCGQKHKAPEPVPVRAKRRPPNAPRSPLPALKISKSASGMRPESSEEAVRPSPPPQQSPVPSGAGNSTASPLGGTASAGCATPESSYHRAEEDIISPPENPDTGASNTGANTEATGRVEPLVTTVPKKKKKKAFASSPSKTVPESSAPASSTSAQGAPDASAPPKTTSMPLPASSARGPATAKPPTPPPSQEPATAKNKPAAVGISTGSLASGAQSIVLHAGHAAIVAGETAPAQLGRITELSRGGASLGHLLDYAEKWNRADLSAATLGLGKDKMPTIDPAGPRNTAQHFSRLRRAVKEFDNAWHDATNNVVVTVPEASIEALKTQLSTLQAEKEQLIRDHRKALDAQEIVSRGLKDQVIQAGLRHDKELKDAQAAAEAKLSEVLEDSTNASAVLRAELEEQSKARKAAEDRVALLTAEQKENDRLVLQTDALALQIFPDSQLHAQKKVRERRVEQSMSNLDAPWDAYDYLVALSARIQHMRAVDRHLADLPDVAIKIFKVLWPEEQVSANLTLTSERLKDAGRRIREWQCSAARAGADHALPIACSWYEDLDLDAFHSLRRDAPTDKNPVLTAKRKDRTYHIAEHAPIRTFIPPPPNVEDYLSDYEEEEEEIDEAGEGDAPPEAAGAGDAPPEAPAV